MRVYLDDSLADRSLVGMLRKAGHTVVRPTEVGLAGKSDALHLEYAIRANLVTLTSDREDFRDLHLLLGSAGGNHPGILMVCYENDPKRDMKAKHVAVAVGKVAGSGLDLGSQLIILNAWR